MKTITRASLKKLTADAEKALAAVAKKHGVQVSFKSGSFTDSNATMKFTISTIDKDGTVNTKEATDFQRYADQFGLKSSDLGNTFSWGGETYKIVGLRIRSRSPVIAERIRDGKIFKMPKHYVNPSLPKTGSAKLTKKIKEEFVDLACQLSPENISCDGEISMAQVRIRRAAIMRKWGALERRINRAVTEDEVWSFHEGLKTDLVYNDND